MVCFDGRVVLYSTYQVPILTHAHYQFNSSSISILQKIQDNRTEQRQISHPIQLFFQTLILTQVPTRCNLLAFLVCVAGEFSAAWIARIFQETYDES